ncbi:hypothetical protein CEY12_15025 [Chryseobacterium sp. T16E-39]|uniref:DUF6876 family protein n=1 Tax=Chryseobacterium sp. T16E-39 TaxID=2015076 RepID=UPI000B5B2054|nr:DUF6876 family protein [Chryseobacterium sp. T16E-39]ASK31336.1 hypothetical protein CEY12_15025 [Chryseobacterium sp. T16E-39]
MKNFTESTSAFYNHFETTGTFHTPSSPSVLKSKTMSNKHHLRRNSANELYDVYSYSQDLHDYKDGYKLTEGINDLVTFEDCSWLFEMILDEQLNLNSENQIWILKRTIPNSFTLTCKNKSGHKLAEIKNLEANFYFDDLTVIKKDKLFCLPTEENLY